MTKEEVRKEQKRVLMMLKTVQKTPKAINNMVTTYEAEMEEEDIAHVEKKLKQLED